MSTKYQNSNEVPIEVLINRLSELSDAIVRGKESFNREFIMRIPAERDRDADLVLAEAARRLIKLEQQLKTCRNDIEIIDGHFKNGWIHELAEALKDD